MLQKLLRLLIIASCFCNVIIARSVHRTSSIEIPEIITQWVGSDKTYHLKHSHLETSAIFNNYDEEYLQKHALPDTEIISRDGTVTFLGSELKELLEELVLDLKKTNHKRTKFKHFTVLKQRDYNPRKHAGLIILKCKKYPVVVKVFMETPESFVSPFSKGFEPSIFFIMASTNRFLSGMLRIRNAQAIKARIAESDYWSKIVDLPRKWFWQPRKQRWFSIRSKNFNMPEQNIVLPSLYVIVCDAIESEETFGIFNKEQRTLAINLSHYLGIKVDPHIDNFMREKGTQKLVLVDSEPFTVMVGLRKPIQFNNYVEWYTALVIKCFCDGFLRDKELRNALYSTTAPQILRC